MHEASLAEDNCFLTPTYAPEHLHRPFLDGSGVWRGSVCMDHFSAFMKRLRDRIKPARVRFHCKSEYSPGLLQPHFHAALFGWLPDDLVPVDKSAAGHVVYRSAFLDEVWGKGLVGVGALTHQSAGYIANHNVDKLDGRRADDAYSRFDFSTGELLEVEPETVRMSTHPGVGRGWVDRFEGDCFPSGFIVAEGFKSPVPRYYKGRLKDRFKLRGSDPDRLAPVDDARLMARKSRARASSPQVVENSTPERLAVREEVLFERVKLLKRNSF
jgi:hypothetical protein